VRCAGNLVGALERGLVVDATLDVFDSLWLRAMFARERDAVRAEHDALQTGTASPTSVEPSLVGRVGQHMLRRAIQLRIAEHESSARARGVRWRRLQPAAAIVSVEGARAVDLAPRGAAGGDLEREERAEREPQVHQPALQTLRPSNSFTVSSFTSTPSRQRVFTATIGWPAFSPRPNALMPHVLQNR
jgi:hypothetical protein